MMAPPGYPKMVSTPSATSASNTALEPLMEFDCVVLEGAAGVA
jgi:hypothetical protein